ncbi:hypothetical protein PIB30_063183 [Stylosanthes scabra]|uniref:Uncharacterized protein n=1 Tax=Stylosanthes scabra TaxID=79078 RepID=A0ABU6RLN7_9FABA|nr:hypothetical protein [Stylosanthes scabra]
MENFKKAQVLEFRKNTQIKIKYQINLRSKFLFDLKFPKLSGFEGFLYECYMLLGKSPTRDRAPAAPAAASCVTEDDDDSEVKMLSISAVQAVALERNRSNGSHGRRSAASFSGLDGYVGAAFF